MINNKLLEKSYKVKKEHILFIIILFIIIFFFSYQKLISKICILNATIILFPFIEKKENPKIDNEINSDFFFLKEILTVFEEKRVAISLTQIININYFLSLINSKYSEELIRQYNISSKEALIKKLIEKTCTYLKEKEKDTFTENDVLEVLTSFANSKEIILKEIAEKFKTLINKSSDTDIYAAIKKIVSIRFLDASNKLSIPVKEHHNFNIENSLDYQEVILSYIQDPYYQRSGFKNPYDIDWDIAFLKKTVKIIIRDYNDILLKTNPNHSNYNLASTLIDNTLTYAIVNNCPIIGPNEIINSLKTWDYLPFNLKLTFLDTILKEESLDPSMHPFRQISSSKVKTYKKIIPFKKVK